MMKAVSVVVLLFSLACEQVETLGVVEPPIQALLETDPSAPVPEAPLRTLSPMTTPRLPGHWLTIDRGEYVSPLPNFHEISWSFTGDGQYTRTNRYRDWGSITVTDDGITATGRGDLIERVDRGTYSTYDGFLETRSPSVSVKQLSFTRDGLLAIGGYVRDGIGQGFVGRYSTYRVEDPPAGMHAVTEYCDVRADHTWEKSITAGRFAGWKLSGTWREVGRNRALFFHASQEPDELPYELVDGDLLILRYDLFSRPLCERARVDYGAVAARITTECAHEAPFAIAQVTGCEEALPFACTGGEQERIGAYITCAFNTTSCDPLGYDECAAKHLGAVSLACTAQVLGALD